MLILGRQVLVLLLSFCQLLCAAPVVVGATKTTISAVLLLSFGCSNVAPAVVHATQTTISAVVLLSFRCSSVAPVVVGVMPASTSAVAFFCSFFMCCTDSI